MSKSRRGIATIGGALLILGVIGTGIANAAPATSSGEGATGSTLDAPPPHAERTGRLREGLPRHVRFGRDLVHATITLTDRNGDVRTIQLDRGSISAIGDNSITIAEAGGASVTVSTSDETRVRKDRAPSSLGALAVGDTVFVRSLVEGGSATARFILVPAPFPAVAGTNAS